MKKDRRPRIFRIVLPVLLVALPAQALFGALPVIDVSNLTQNILQVSHAIQQIRHLFAQLDTMRRNLERITDPNWRQLAQDFLYWNELAAQGEALTYADEAVWARYRALLEGFRPMAPEQFNSTYGHWNRVALDTFAATLDSASAQSQEYASTQEQLDELRAIADESDHANRWDADHGF